MSLIVVVANKWMVAGMFYSGCLQLYVDLPSMCFFCFCSMNFPSNKFTQSAILSNIFSSTQYSGIGMIVQMIEIVSEILVDC